jgi:hypothetical protein
MRRVGFVAFAAVLSSVTAASAEICLGPVTALGERSHDQNMARSNAAHSWRLKVSAEHGAHYAAWSKAKSKRIVCHTQTGGSPNAPLLKFQCKARAQPCSAITINPDLKDAVE